MLHLFLLVAGANYILEMSLRYLKYRTWFGYI
jgi:hypothetical protein